MGLIYQFPVQENPLDDRISIKEGEVTLKNYGLPLIFWGYMAIILVVIFFMYFAIQNPTIKLINTPDPINKLLGISVFSLLILIPLTLLSFFFYEKIIQKKGDILILTHKLFWIPCWRKTIFLKNPESFTTTHFMDSPNIAAKHQDPRLKSFQNRGYHQLFAECKKGEMHFIDRHSQSGEIKKIRELLLKH